MAELLDREVETEEPGTRRSMDSELLVMSRMVRLLDDLEEVARARVVAWLSSRYATR